MVRVTVFRDSRFSVFGWHDVGMDADVRSGACQFGFGCCRGIPCRFDAVHDDRGISSYHSGSVGRGGNRGIAAGQGSVSRGIWHYLYLACGALAAQHAWGWSAVDHVAVLSCVGDRYGGLCLWQGDWRPETGAAFQPQENLGGAYWRHVVCDADRRADHLFQR